MDKEFNRVFDKCPCCGSENRFCEQLANELKERGLAREEWAFTYDDRRGTVVDPTKEPTMPIGTEVPTFLILSDVCMDCGCIYATKLVRGDRKKPSPIQLPPNRAQRRRGEQPFSLS